LTVGLGALPGILIALLGADGTGAALGILGGTAGAVVMMWLFIQLSLTPAVLMLEKQSVTEAVKRSWKLVSGAWWRVLGVQLLAVLVVTIATSVVELPFILIGEAASGNDSSGLLDSSAPLTWTYLTYVAVGGTIASAFTLPITAGTTTLLYLDQRIRRESLDLELIRASRNG
ncbi:glycerophosphoryl diester phosphodiesterase membrane domain-containing protein, partial [Actinacidiphila rubida]